jgi:hypothetical protein
MRAINQMTNRKGRASARRLVAIHVDGQMCPAWLTAMTGEQARVELQGEHEVSEGQIVALAVAGLPTMPGDIRKLEGDVLDIEFRSVLHPSVIEFIHEALPTLPSRRTAS